MPAASLPRLPGQEHTKVLPIRSPLLALELELTQAAGGDDKIAACFRALQGLLSAVAQPLRPLIRLVSQELMTALYGGRRGHLEELRMLRTRLRQRELELTAARESASRLAIEQAILSQELALAEHDEHEMLADEARLVGLTASPSHIPSPNAPLHTLGAHAGAAARGDGQRMMRLTAALSGRNLYDRIDNVTQSLRHPSEQAHRSRVLARSEHALSQHKDLMGVDGSGEGSNVAEGAAVQASPAQPSPVKS